MKIEATMTQNPRPSLLSSTPRDMNTNKQRGNKHVAGRTQYQNKICKLTLTATDFVPEPRSPESNLEFRD
jgi:hypothetical protein